MSNCSIVQIIIKKLERFLIRNGKTGKTLLILDKWMVGWSETSKLNKNEEEENTNR